eukprot:4694834-Pleurochrysis_carterae.AAC.2
MSSYELCNFLQCQQGDLICKGCMQSLVWENRLWRLCNDKIPPSPWHSIARCSDELQYAAQAGQGLRCATVTPTGTSQCQMSLPRVAVALRASSPTRAIAEETVASVSSVSSTHYEERLDSTSASKSLRRGNKQVVGVVDSMISASVPTVAGVKEVGATTSRFVHSTVDPFHEPKTSDNVMPGWFSRVSHASSSHSPERRVNSQSPVLTGQKGELDPDLLHMNETGEHSQPVVDDQVQGGQVQGGQVQGGRKFSLAPRKMSLFAGPAPARKMSSGLNLTGWFAHTLHRESHDLDDIDEKDLQEAGLDKETVHEILHADTNRDGKVTYDELLTHLKSLVSTRRQYRRAARFLGLLVLLLVVIITAIVVGTAITLKDST